jgi:hypothetical protein
MTLLLGVVLAAGLQPYWAEWWQPYVAPIVIPPNALELGHAWPAGDMCAWYPPDMDQPLPCALRLATETRE